MPISDPDPTSEQNEQVRLYTDEIDTLRDAKAEIERLRAIVSALNGEAKDRGTRRRRRSNGAAIAAP